MRKTIENIHAVRANAMKLKNSNENIEFVLQKTKDYYSTRDEIESKHILCDRLHITICNFQ